MRYNLVNIPKKPLIFPESDQRYGEAPASDQEAGDHYAYYAAAFPLD